MRCARVVVFSVMARMSAVRFSLALARDSLFLAARSADWISCFVRLGLYLVSLRAVLRNPIGFFGLAWMVVSRAFSKRSSL